MLRAIHGGSTAQISFESPKFAELYEDGRFDYKNKSSVSLRTPENIVEPAKHD